MDADLLLLVCRLVFCRYVHDAVGVDIKCHLNLRHATRRWRDADEIKLAKHFIIRGHFAFALENANSDCRLIIFRCRENLTFLSWDRCIAIDETREYASQRLNA